MPQATDLRDCRLYRFYGWDPRTNYTTKTLIYIGETARHPFQRLMEHVADKPWADTITSWEVDDRSFAGKGEVLAAETSAIRDERPLYNYSENLDNPHRVEIWRQEIQRHERDDAAGRWRWTKPTPGAAKIGVRPVPSSSVRRWSSPGSWSPWQQKISLWSIAWVSSTLVTWGVLVRIGWPLSTGTRTLAASTLCAAVLLLSLWLNPARRRRYGRKLRKAGGWFR